jgi:hypothetical protein
MSLTRAAGLEVAPEPMCPARPDRGCVPLRHGLMEQNARPSAESTHPHQLRMMTAAAEPTAFAGGCGPTSACSPTRRTRPVFDTMMRLISYRAWE